MSPSLPSNSSIPPAIPIPDKPGCRPMALRKYADPAHVLGTYAEPVSKVLVLYTGGTIGMKKTPNGLACEAGYLPDRMSRMLEFTDPDVEEKYITPVSEYGKRVRYTIIECDPLLDSANMDMGDWQTIASIIGDNYQEYDGFLILHGTDTMAYTASALSFMLENLGKTVILTGSQIPLSKQRNDALSNLLGALIMAGHFLIPEVCVFFRDQLLRGNRTTKTDSEGLDAFHTPNCRPLAEVSCSIKIHWSAIRFGSDVAAMTPFMSMAPEIGVCYLFPGVPTASVKNTLAPPVRGVILRSYGAGNAPLRPDLLQVFNEAAARGVVIVNITQCSKGTVSALYETGVRLLQNGVVPGNDMTPEAALAKLSFWLGKGETPESVRLKLQEDMHGELTPADAAARVCLNDKSGKFIRHVAHTMAVKTEEEVKQIAKGLWPVLLCIAAGNGDVEAVQEMLSQGALVNSSDYDKRTALHLAAAEGHLSCVEMLLHNGALVHAKDRWQRTPIHDAHEAGHTAVVHLLTQAGASLGDLGRHNSHSEMEHHNNNEDVNNRVALAA